MKNGRLYEDQRSEARYFYVTFKGHHSPSDVLVYVPARASLPVRQLKEKRRCNTRHEEKNRARQKIVLERKER